MLHVKLKDNGVAVDWSGLQNVKAFMYSDAQRCIAGKCDVEVDGSDGTVLNVTYPATKPQYLGVNSLLVRCKYYGREKSYDVPVGEFVERTAQATGVTVIEDPEMDVEIEVDEVSTSLLDGAIAAALDAAVHAEEAAEKAEHSKVQSDWDQADGTAPDYIKNKPTLPDEFIAMYGVTTYAEITAALSDGKTVTMNRDGLIYGYCGEDIRHRYRFAALLGGLVGQGEPNVSAQLCLVSSADEWTNTYAMILTRSDIVTSMDAQSTNTQVPGAKAVYDAIQAAGGGGGLHIISNNGSPFHSEQDLVNYQGPVEDGDIAWVCGPVENGFDYLALYVYDVDAWSQFFEYNLPIEAVMYDVAQSLNSTQKARARTNIGAGTYSKPDGGIPAADLAGGVIPTVPVQDVTVGGTSVVSSGTAVIPAIPSAPGTLNTNNTSAQTAKSSEALSGTIKLHKVSKTGSYNDLLDKPTIPAAQIQSDWDQSDNTALDYIKNKPTIPDTSNFVQKSQTAGLLKNDGTVDTTVYGTYSKPSGGIPSSDMASAVQTSLGKADTAYQKPSGGIPASDLASGVIPTVPTISTDIASDKTSNTKTASPKAVYDEVHPAPGSSEPSGGFLPNVVYNLGTITGSRSFAMAAAVSGIVNHYYWTFDTGSTAPTITWPAAITAWNGGSAPTINASKHYEISVLNGIGAYMEV